jgi:exopolyphosphatase/guanosine-5'-triphosphate,3'-diphosphate pyrophosphatase
LANADLPGFVRLEQQLLSTLIGSHRRKLDELKLDALPDDWHAPLFKLIVLLRLAVLLNRARSPVDLPPMRLVGFANKLELDIAKAWMANNPLTQADLGQEQEFLQSRGFELAIGIIAED